MRVIIILRLNILLLLVVFLAAGFGPVVLLTASVIKVPVIPGGLERIGYLVHVVGEPVKFKASWRDVHDPVLLGFESPGIEIGCQVDIHVLDLHLTRRSQLLFLELLLEALPVLVKLPLFGGFLFTALLAWDLTLLDVLLILLTEL